MTSPGAGQVCSPPCRTSPGHGFWAGGPPLTEPAPHHEPHFPGFFSWFPPWLLPVGVTHCDLGASPHWVPHRAAPDFRACIWGLVAASTCPLTPPSMCPDSTLSIHTSHELLPAHRVPSTTRGVQLRKSGELLAVSNVQACGGFHCFYCMVWNGLVMNGSPPKNKQTGPSPKNGLVSTKLWGLQRRNVSPGSRQGH